MNLVPSPLGPVVGLVVQVVEVISPTSGGGTNSHATSGNLPAGFQTNLPAGIYQLQVCVQVTGGYGSCTELPGTYSDAAAVAQALQNVDLCQGVGVSCTSKYTAWNGTYFDVTVTMKTCSGGTCVVSVVMIRVTKVG